MSTGNLQGFDANNVAPSSFEVVPAGEYEVAIVSSVVETTKDKLGKFLKLELAVLNGQYQNKKIFDRLNLWNKSAQATEIARGTLSAICRAVGVMTPEDSSALHNKPMRVKVVVKKSPEFGESNEVKAYKPRNGAPPAPPAPPADGAPVSGTPWPVPPSAEDTRKQAEQRF
jgi:hypothetical protein